MALCCRLLRPREKCQHLQEEQVLARPAAICLFWMGEMASSWMNQWWMQQTFTAANIRHNNIWSFSAQSTGTSTRLQFQMQQLIPVVWRVFLTLPSTHKHHAQRGNTKQASSVSTVCSVSLSSLLLSLSILKKPRLGVYKCLHFQAMPGSQVRFDTCLNPKLYTRECSQLAPFLSIKTKYIFAFVSVACLDL